ncbi:SDR family NAD(P)-dependent oxidoreductase [Vagococcus sp. WN89Y]|uniref:SDR family NAD(P)-dependent oxidoreductase n=1 Tax=Vagococcus sp. WN89Y TaxID=3457258 RepID=UPI003FCDE928
MSYALSGKRALVTGASRGLGKAIALTLARAGADVAITFEKSAQKAGDVAGEIQALGRNGLAIQADSARPEAVRAAVTQAVEALGGLDILVNNAGIAYGGSLEEMSQEQIDALINVNIRGVVYATQAALAYLPDGGRIINIGSSLSDRVPLQGVAIYSMTKSALNSLTRGLARDLGARGITVNMVKPGSTDSDMNPANGENSETQRQLTALGHYGEPQDIAEAVAFLASPAAKQITGADIVVDGGANA